MSDLSEQVALVTGGGSGIGAAIAERLRQHRAHVVVLDLSAPDPAQAENGVEFEFADVTDPESIQQAVANVHDRLGPIDIAVANAGVPGVGTAVSTSVEEWNRVIAVNLTGVWLLASAVLPGMQAQRGGAIVNISSVSAVAGMRAVAAYSAAKAGVIGLTRQIAADYARDGIRVNAVCPGLTRTPMLEAQYEAVVAASAGAASAEDRIAADLRKYPLKRLGDPADIAAAVAYLAGPDAGWITGAVLPVDGGYSAV